MHGSALPPAPCQHPAGECPGWHHQKEHLTAHKPFFFFFSPLVLPARLSPLQGKQSCHCLNLTHPFNLGGRNAFVPDNMHQMVARGAPVAAGPDGWATRASPDLCLYVICIAAGGFSSRRQLQHHLPGSGSLPGAGSSGQEGPGHVAGAGTAAPRPPREAASWSEGLRSCGAQGRAGTLCLHRVPGCGRAGAAGEGRRCLTPSPSLRARTWLLPGCPHHREQSRLSPTGVGKPRLCCSGGRVLCPTRSWLQHGTGAADAARAEASTAPGAGGGGAKAGNKRLCL